MNVVEKSRYQNSEAISWVDTRPFQGARKEGGGPALSADVRV
jgi:hypothetical protein